MIRLLIADDEKLEREALADMVSRGERPQGSGHGRALGSRPHPDGH